MNISENSIIKKQTLNYLGYNGQNIDNNLDSLIDNCIIEVKEKSNPRVYYERFNVTKKNNNTINSVVLNSIDISKNSSITIYSNDLSNLLVDCSECIIISATLGFEIDKLIKYYSKFDITKAMIIDSSASAYIEYFLDEYERENIFNNESKEYEQNLSFNNESKEFEQNLSSNNETCDSEKSIVFNDESKKFENLTSKNYNRTFRFAPGYDDLSLEYNREILKLLDLNKNLKIFLNPSNLFEPMKTILGIIGVRKNDLLKIYDIEKNDLLKTYNIEKNDLLKTYNLEKSDLQKSCNNCIVSKNCPFKRRGTTCY
ncbi:MAG: hypothetical protein LBR30_04915 [Clostridioides sp.]|jgi:hypothetical protein|nr:hypothetical protein [Clostridioides sp.]